MKTLDAAVGRSIVPFLPKPVVKELQGPVTSILIIRPGGIGDAVMLIPAIQAIRMKYPSVQISILAEKRNGAVFDLCPEVDQVLLYDHPSALLTALRQRYDVVIDSEQWHRLSAVVARLTRAPVLVGFGTNERARLFTHPIPYDHDDYEADSFARLLAPLGVTVGGPERFLAVPDDVKRTITGLLSGIDQGRFVTMFPGASIKERRWGYDKFRRLAELLAAFGIVTVIVGGKEDRAQGDNVVAGGLGVNLAGKTSLVGTAAVIDHSALLVSGDSGVLHIAVGLGKPTVSLFGPGRVKKWAPRGERHTVINKGLPCSPCTTYGTTPPCPSNAKCMGDITADEVFNAVMIMLTAEKVLASACCKKDWIEVSG